MTTRTLSTGIRQAAAALAAGVVTLGVTAAPAAARAVLRQHPALPAGGRRRRRGPGRGAS